MNTRRLFVGSRTTPIAPGTPLATNPGTPPPTDPNLPPTTPQDPVPPTTPTQPGDGGTTNPPAPNPTTPTNPNPGGGTQPAPQPQPQQPPTNPPTDTEPDDWDTVTVYSDADGPRGSDFRVDDDGVSTFEIPFRNKKFVVPFTVRYKKPKVPGVTGTLTAPELAGGTATFTPDLGDPLRYHWSLNFVGKTKDEIKQLLSDYGKAHKLPGLTPGTQEPTP